mmetsp:Transcript_59901/g.177600  ORF Transcript_59901/g.177600 Transcript_59901/m.177600 type:complete len:84 (-) Transcript_59901:1721-1972(-)
MKNTMSTKRKEFSSFYSRQLSSNLRRCRDLQPSLHSMLDTVTATEKSAESLLSSWVSSLFHCPTTYELVATQKRIFNIDHEND